MRKPWLSLLLLLTASYAAGFIGSIATNKGLEFWYVTLQKPLWNPPMWLFAPMWTVLYGLMGVAAWLVYEADTEVSGRRTRALVLFFSQLVLNALWPWIFFGWHLIAGGLAVIALLLLIVIAMTATFFKTRPLAGWLVLPYPLWLAYATALNYAIWSLNR